MTSVSEPAPTRTGVPTPVLAPTTLGPVRGLRDADGVARFLGIPYGRPPIGPLRFAAPVPCEPWTEPLDATAYGPTAQRRPLGEVTIIPEPSVPGAGVLNLNVFTPRLPAGAETAPAGTVPTEGLPVLVWIHGGGYVAGSAASPWYDGAAFNRDGVIVVSVGYRLGVEGFLALPDAPDNRAVRDWIAALTWVRDNIAGFGGDPARVTIAGQSAGGGAVQTLLAAPAAADLFRSAISVSGAVMEPQDRATAELVARRFAERTGVPATAAALTPLTDDELLDLQAAIPVTGPLPDADGVPGMPLAPFADGEVIPVPVMDVLTDGSGPVGRVPLMLGFTAHEFNLAAPPGADEALDRAILGALGLDAPAQAAYAKALGVEDTGALRAQAVTDALFRAPGLRIAEGRAAHAAPTWLYEFRWESPVMGSAFHCLDLPFAFDLLAAPNVTAVAGERPPQALADAVHGAWVAFVRDGAPGPDWPAYSAEGRETRLWDETVTTPSDPLGAIRAVWLD
ncbi:carboxylesterase/lipase family protein (plasmid) [Streptomyces sp. BI20]|uniref:carboxylesterase/lipase family protein n=1 Tax=Streptomyces sp. BI20 TaxID=3403460 RepID=UPI003C72B623